MYKEVKKIISACLAILTLSATVSYIPAWGETTTLVIATPSEATPSEATPSEATPSEATPSVAEKVEFHWETPEKSEIPGYYQRKSYKGIRYYGFTDRYEEERYRIYGRYEDGTYSEWYECNEKGEVTRSSQWIDFDWEYDNLAPFIYESAEPDSQAWQDLEDRGYGEEYERTYLPDKGKNADLTSFGVWELTQEEECFYFLYGHIVNDGDASDQWYRVSASGEVEEILLRQPFLMRQMFMARAVYYPYEADWWLDGLTEKGSLETIWASGYVVKYTRVRRNSSYRYWYTVDMGDRRSGAPDVVTVHNTCNAGIRFLSNSRDNMHQDQIFLYAPDGTCIGYDLGDSDDIGFYKKGLPDGVYRFVWQQYVENSEGDGGWYTSKDIYVELISDIHSANPEVTTINPTCTTPGTRTTTYSCCGVSTTETLSMLGHSWEGAYQRVAPTCTTIGKTAHRCSRCGTVEDTADIPALGHSWPSSYVTTANNGTYYKNCTRCGARLETKYNPYTVTYNGNGNTGGSTAKSSHTYNTAKSLTPNGFTKKYYTFDSWNTKADGSGTKYSNKQSVNNLTGVYNGNVPLYARWKRSSSLVTYKDWNGTVLKTQEVAQGGTATPPQSPSRTGYTFTGWDKASSNIQDHTTITAKYSINSYKLTLKGNGGTINSKSSQETNVVYNTSFDTALSSGRDSAVRTGYTFSGWYTQPSGGSRYGSSGNQMPASDVVVYAQWTPNTYMVKFDPSHVRWTEGPIGEAHTFDTKLGVLPAPELYGWKFLGWRTEKNGGGLEITKDSMVEPRDVTYYGNWKPEQYHIHYVSQTEQPDGASVQTFPAVQTYDALLGELPRPEEPGYTFKGWYDGESQVTEDTIFCPEAGAEGYTYQAKWEPNVYHVKLLGNHYGCEPVIKEFDVTYMSKLGSLPEPEAAGYTFKGWFNGEEQVTEESWAEPRNADYEAQWSANTYTIHFNKNLYAIEENPEDKQVIYDETLGELPVLDAEGYTFKGWYTEAEGGEQVTEDSPVPLGDTTYYAHWTHNTYVLNLITGNAVNLIREFRAVFDIELGELPIPRLEDFKFRGWFTSPYSETLREGILRDTATPNEAERIDNTTVYRLATDSNAYAYFDLVYQEEEGNINRRGGKDEVLGTEDDNFYYNGVDREPGTSDDAKIYSGKDGAYGTGDDFYYYEESPAYSGKDKTFGTPDDYLDLGNGTNLRPGGTGQWRDPSSFIVNNGHDGLPGTGDDWIWENEEAGTVREPGEDGVFRTGDDELWWIGSDGTPGTGDDRLIEKGLDGEQGTPDDYVDNKDNTNYRPGIDNKWGTGDDESWWNGPDGIPGTADDRLIEKGLDGQYGTPDDFVDNGDNTNHHSGIDNKWGTGDDESWWNGPDREPGTGDDKIIKSGLDDKQGTPDDFVDLGNGTNLRPGSDNKWGTGDNILWWNGSDGIPGTDDDKLINSGADGVYGTPDDFIDNGDGTSLKPGSDGKWGTNDDELWWHGSGGIPGNADDMYINPGADGVYGTPDDFIDNGDGTKRLAGADGLWGSSDDEILYNTGSEKSAYSRSGDDRDSGINGTGGEWLYSATTGFWSYRYDSEGTTSGWAYLGYQGKQDWYHFDKDGHMQTGWFRDVDGKWYYLHDISDGTKGHMYTGWNKISGKWYYFNEKETKKGYLYTGTITPDGYQVDATGAWVGNE